MHHQPIKILHIIASMDPVSGGPCQGIRNLNDVLKQMGIQREVVCLDDPKSSYLGMDNFPIYAIGPTRTKWQHCPKLVPWLMKNLERFDIVVINGIWLYHVFAAIKTLEKCKKKDFKFVNNSRKFPKTFIMLHGMLDPYFQKDKSRRLKALRNWIYWYLIEGNNIKSVDGLLFACKIELELAKQTFRYYKPKKEINVGYGIEEPPVFTNEMISIFNEKCPGLKDSPYILFLGRIHQKKGIELAIRAYTEILKITDVEDRTDLPRLVIAGPGMDSSYGAKLRAMISNDAVASSFVFFPGMLTGSAKWGAFYGSEAFVLSSHQENFGISVVEALACEKPVLISDQVNIWKEIIDGGAGIVREDTLAGTFELLRCWMNMSKNEKCTMAKNARATYENNFGVLTAAMRFTKAVVYN